MVPPATSALFDAGDLSLDRPRPISRAIPRADRVFRTVSAGAALVSLVIICATAAFLAWSSRSGLQAAGFTEFFTTSVWNAGAGKFGVAGLLLGTVLIALIGLGTAVPLAIGLALFANEYAPARVRRTLTGAIDLLAALPSLIFGLWGLYALQGPLKGVAQWFADHLSAIPIFRVQEGADLSRSAFIGGVVLGLMILPIVTSITRDVMAQCPREQCEAAFGLGGTRAGMIRSVLLPFSRSGTVGAILLGFGRALGETVAILIIVALQVKPSIQVLEVGGGSIAAWIASRFGEAGEVEISALIAAGLALFVLTLAVNLGARRIVNKARTVT
jgi:phosphate transport system permease protein